MKTKTYTLRLTHDQVKLLEAKANSAGFRRKSDYIRTVLFLDFSFEEKINEIHKLVKEWKNKK